MEEEEGRWEAMTGVRRVGSRSRPCVGCALAAVAGRAAAAAGGDGAAAMGGVKPAKVGRRRRGGGGGDDGRPSRGLVLRARDPASDVRSRRAEEEGERDGGCSGSAVGINRASSHVWSSSREGGRGGAGGGGGGGSTSSDASGWVWAVTSTIKIRLTLDNT